ncbi:GntR family transcriptional regulator [Falsiroseomonas sp. E2-1-a20]|uniref:GntR family transcriptional regulator n=1 Tax=Falsiroseomonas sp. E2-1-a20 TaxID=3239300 RepID=UPI003F40B296
MPGAEEARTLTSAVHACLRADLIACRILPGEKLPIVLLSQRFRVSAAIVREALSRLVADGLVVAEDQRGFRASPLTLADLQDLAETRIEIECLTLRRSMARGGAAWQESVQVAWKALRAIRHPPPEAPAEEHDAWSALHARFHAALVGGCGLDWLMRFRTTLYEQSERYRRMSRFVRGLSRDVAAEHDQIFRAVMQGDAGQAVALLAAHLQRTADDIANAARNQGLSDQGPRIAGGGSRWGQGA